MARTGLVLFALFLRGAVAASASTSHTANPIRRVVKMLQKMQQKVQEEGKRDEELFEKFSCYCKKGGGDLEASISAAEAKIPQVSSSLDEAIATKDQLDKDLAQHKTDRADAKESLASATALREKEAAEYAKESGDTKTNIAALGKAIAALEKGTGSFLQTSAAGVLRRLTVEMDMSTADREVLSSFLSQTQGYVPQSGQIIGILKQMKDTMEASLAELTATEEKAIADYEAVAASKTKEMKANTEAIQSKLERAGQVGVEIETLKEDLDDTQKSLAEDKKFLADLEKNCAAKTAEWEAVKKTRADEMLAIAETIKILNDDDALELFKATLPSPSLLQTQVNAKELRQRALTLIQSAQRTGAAHADTRLDFLALALRGRKVSFEKVLGMIDEMVALLKQEQTDDDEKKAYCESSLDKSEDELKVLERTISDLEKAEAEAKSLIATLAEEIATLEKGIKDLDARVAEATENRKAEHAEYSKTLADDTAAKNIIGMAKNRLNLFYNPKLAKQPEPTVEPSEMQVSQGVAPPPPPEAFEPYTKKGQESAGVLTMMDMLIADLDKELQEIEVDEKDAQKEYEELMADSATKRAADAKFIEEKEGAKADTEAELQKLGLEKSGKMKEAMATAGTIKDLHLECDWLLANFEARKSARAGEVDSLNNAKAVLSGAEYSLVQTAHSRLVSVDRH
eukprot:CAMPEP_0171056566 /NCGR_PEP_ID=MMETSP0766_2-20121228/1138_1 /TAXON_ID=439317 /ORGANISM="Gambierdiscus australes, Strain CAWD 149" /LENGTH=685 /DNA_ID=CAMNT_0011511513 /DNA_START=75 /DNA_END=2132 /DNA_ORIENTATION=+